PVERNAVISAVHVPEAQRAGTSRDCELLIERAVSEWFVIILLAIGILLRVTPCECGKSPAVYKVGGDHRIVGVAVNYPGRKTAGLKSFVLDYPGITLCRSCRRSRGRCGCRCSRWACCWCRSWSPPAAGQRKNVRAATARP